MAVVILVLLEDLAFLLLCGRGGINIDGFALCGHCDAGGLACWGLGEGGADGCIEVSSFVRASFVGRAMTSKAKRGAT